MMDGLHPHWRGEAVLFQSPLLPGWMMWHMGCSHGAQTLPLQQPHRSRSAAAIWLLMLHPKTALLVETCASRWGKKESEWEEGEKERDRKRRDIGRETWFLVVRTDSVLSQDAHFALKVEINTAANLDSFRFVSTPLSVPRKTGHRRQGTNWKRIFLPGSIKVSHYYHSTWATKIRLLVLCVPLCGSGKKKPLSGQIKPQRGRGGQGG